MSEITKLNKQLSTLLNEGIHDKYAVLKINDIGNAYEVIDSIEFDDYDSAESYRDERVLDDEEPETVSFEIAYMGKDGNWYSVDTDEPVAGLNDGDAVGADDQIKVEVLGIAVTYTKETKPNRTILVAEEPRYTEACKELANKIEYDLKVSLDESYGIMPATSKMEFNVSIPRVIEIV
jgi:hypothetical protein